MKRQLYYGLFTSLIFALPACQSPENRAVNQNKSQDTTMNNSSSTTGSKELNQSNKNGSGNSDHNYSFHTKVTDDDLQFMNNVKTIGMMEITLGTVAQKSADPNIKAFADMMIKDHRLLNQEVEKLATAAKVVLSVDYDAKQQEELKMMRGLIGSEFDKQYKVMMVNGHAKALELFRRGADTNEEAVKKFANKYVSIIKNHYEAAKKL